MSRRAHRCRGQAAAVTAEVAAAIATAARFNRWGATAEEASRVLPGDDEVANPLLDTTRAITIRAPAQAVWPWLVQMGWRRGGWYSYGTIDNDHLPSADHIIPALQGDLHPGDFVPEGPATGWTVTQIEPGRLLLLTSHGPMPGVDWVDRRDSSWLFLIDPIDAQRSRLVERSRTSVTGNRTTRLGALANTRIAGAAWAVGDFVMAHRHMKGIKRRAELEWERTHPPVPPHPSRNH